MQSFDTIFTVGEFTDRVGNAAGRSAEMELQSVSSRMGGNAPLMAEALACLNVLARCIGSIGYPTVLLDAEQIFALTYI